MKSPKKPSKEPPLPSQDESRRTNVLFEKLLSEFRTFGEAQSIMRERLDRMEPDLHAVKEDVAVLKIAARSHSEILRNHTEILNRHTEILNDHTETLRVHTEILNRHSEILNGHTEDIRVNTEAIQAVQADLKTYNQRLELVEAKRPS